MTSALLLLRRLGLATVLFALGVTAVAGVNSWTAIGPEGGYARAVAFHPVLPGVVFTSAGSSIYRSTDAGASWTAVRDDIPNGVTRIVFDPANISRVMAAGFSALYRSDDGGLSFAAITAPGPTGTLAVAPDGSALYATTVDGKVFRSIDFGVQWEERLQGLPQQYVADLVVDPQNANTLYAVIPGRPLYKSIDAGLHWSLHNPLDHLAAFKIAVDPGISTQLLLATTEGLFASQDGGANWARERAGSYGWVGYHPSQPTSLIGAALAIPRFGGRVIRRAGRGLAWIEGQELELPAVEDAAFDPHNLHLIDSTLLVAGIEGPLLTEDGGMSFSVRSQGIRASTATSLVAANDAQGTMYAAFWHGPAGVYRRTASGWTPVDNAELRAAITEPFQPLALATDRSNPDTLFVASGTSVVHSLDGGQSWSAPHPEFLLGNIHARAMSFDPSNSQVIYIGTEQHGVYRTENGGFTWLPRTTGLPGGIGAIAVDAGGTVYAVNRDLQIPLVPVLSKTTDGGMTWAPASVGLELLPETLAVDPMNPAVIYAGGFGSGQGRLYKSMSAGQSWARVDGAIGSSPAYSIAIDPLVPTTLVMSMNASGLGASRSVDGGATWEDLRFVRPGGPNIITRVVLDPLKPHVVVASVDNHGLIEFEVSPDLEATLPAIPATLPLGGSGTVIARVTNRGPLAASAVKLTLSLPAGMTSQAPAPAQGTCTQGAAGFECALGAVHVNQHVDTVLTLAAANAPAQETLVASVTGRESDSIFGNNSVSAAITTDTVADVNVQLAESADPIVAGGSVQYTATITNAGPNELPSATVTVNVAGATVTSASSDQGTCTTAAATVTCALHTVAAGGDATVTVGAAAAAPGTASATASVMFPGTDPGPANNSATQSTTVNAAQSGGGGGASGSGGSGASAGAVADGGGGGGGASGLIDAVILLGLLGAGLIRRASRRDLRPVASTWIGLSRLPSSSSNRAFGTADPGTACP